MDDEFLDEEFYMKLLRLGSQHPDLRKSARKILKRIEENREDEGEE